MIKSIVITLVTLFQSPIGHAAALEDTHKRRLVGMRLRTITKQQTIISDKERLDATRTHETHRGPAFGHSLDTAGPWSSEPAITNRKMSDTFKRAAASSDRPMRPDCNIWGQPATRH